MSTRVFGAMGIAALAFLAGFAAAPAGFTRDRAVVELSHIGNALALLDREQKYFDELMLVASDEDKKPSQHNALAIQKSRTALKLRMLNLCYDLEDTIDSK